MLGVKAWVVLGVIIQVHGKHLQHDKMGRIMMGVPNSKCDEGKIDSNFLRDINCNDFLCTSHEIKGTAVPKVKRHCHLPLKKPVHICMKNSIHYDKHHIPSSGPHRPLWPKYGEYAYVPPQRWLHSIEHGAAVFLYNPCIEGSQVAVLREIAKATIPNKHIITPYDLPSNMPLAVVTWRCVLQMSAVDLDQTVKFVKETALKGPEDLDSDGQYDVGYNQNLRDFIGTKICSNL